MLYLVQHFLFGLLFKHLPDLLEKCFGVLFRFRLKIITCFHAFQHCFFLIRYFLWCPDVYMNQLISFSLALHRWETFSFKSENFACLCTCRYFYFGFTINSRHLNFGTKNSIRERYIEFISDI